MRFTLLARSHLTKHFIGCIRKFCEAIKGLPHDACADVKMLWSTKITVCLKFSKSVDFLNVYSASMINHITATLTAN